jgi:hypothetical protein
MFKRDEDEIEGLNTRIYHDTAGLPILLREEKGVFPVGLGVRASISELLLHNFLLCCELEFPSMLRAACLGVGIVLPILATCSSSLI